MKGVKELKGRLKSVGNIKKITKAMEMVAATKLRRLQERALATRPFADKIEDMIRRVAGHVDPSFSPLLNEPNDIRSEALVVVAGDRGLCGAYNSNVFRVLVAQLNSLKDEGVEPVLFVVGRRAQAFAGRLAGIELGYVHPNPVEKIEYREVRRIVTDLTAGFLDGRWQRVKVIYTSRKSVATFVPTIAELLPIPREHAEEGGAELDYILEPSPKAIMERLLPRFLEMQLFADVLEALASEFGARRIAMKSATDNADEMIGMLTMEYNRARQEGITGDLLDIIGGTEALSA